MKQKRNTLNELERAATSLDELTVARLRAARLRAVAAAEARRPSRMAWWLPLPAAALVALIAVTTTLMLARGPEPTMTAAGDDVDWLIATGEAPDFFKEQLEFYHWLGDEPDAG